MSLYEIRKLINTGVSINNIKLRVTFYARVSTSKDEQLNSLYNQISYFVDYIKKNSNWEYIEGYIDEGVSATKINNRNNFIRMINDAKNDKFDLILTKEVSRFSRDTIDSLEYTRKLLEYDTAVYFLSDNINTINSDSELRLTLMSSLAQDEVRKLSERTKFGLRRAVLSGKVLGNNNIYGYKKNNGTLIIDVESKHLIENIFTLYVKENISLRALSDKLFNMGFKSNNDTPLHPNTIKRIIMNPKYKGNFTGLITEKVNYRSNKRRKNNDNMINYECSSIPKIISKELWNKANKKMIERGSNRALSQKGNKYLFSSKLICSKHNCGYVHRYTQKNKDCYFCKNYNDTGRRSCEHSILIEKDLKNVLNSYFNTLNIKNIKSSLINRYMNVLSSYKLEGNYDKELNKIKDNNNNLLNLLIDNIISRDEYNIKIKENKDKKNIYINKVTNNLDVLDIEKIKLYLSVNNIIIEDIINEFIKKIEIFNDSFKIIFDNNSFIDLELH